MKRALIFIVTLLGLLLASWALTYSMGYCVWCVGYECVNSSSCGGGCICAKADGEVIGFCASF